ncbi:hemin-degrading factor [Actibacterium ureilyticum]|uniref:hemin-degrading factor n=1 Tax=Actibacterium ureilyticum TaxID=1590614 RepID=UPI000BAB1CC5|nr:ChuX/HutX family heme-like substrate-binding protein [Actibacterium ureilyticum]
MSGKNRLSAEDIRTARAENDKLRARDLAAKLGITEAALVAADIGHTVTRIEAHPDRVIAHVMNLGPVMALTRNESCVIEKVGVFENYRGGEHATMVVNKDIDSRFFPRHWVHAFAIDDGARRSVQIFDAAGDAVHKIFLREESDLQEWQKQVTALALADQSADLSLSERVPTEPPRADPDKADRLRAEWDQMTDTHQFMGILRKLKMNRLGAYRIAGAPYVRPLPGDAVDTLLSNLSGTGIHVMIFVGNMGCIQIHGGPVDTVKPMGPWLNVLDPGFNLHLRADHIAEVVAVAKSSRQGPALSVEAFDKDGMLILQIFGTRREDPAHFDAFAEMVAALVAQAAPVEAAE